MIIFLNCGFFLCLQKNLSIFCSRRETVKCHWEFIKFGVKLKQYIRIGSSSLLLPRNSTHSQGNELVLMWNVDVITEFVELTLLSTLTLFSTRIFNFWPRLSLYSISLVHFYPVHKKLTFYPSSVTFGTFGKAPNNIIYLIKHVNWEKYKTLKIFSIFHRTYNRFIS